MITDVNASHRAYVTVTAYSQTLDAIRTQEIEVLCRRLADDRLQFNGTTLPAWSLVSYDEVRCSKVMLADIIDIPARYIASFTIVLKPR